MTKSNRLYKIFMTSMIVIIAGLLLATGIISIQKQMKLKASFDYIPGVDVEIYAKNDSGEELIFSNYANGQNGIYVNADYCTLSATTLTFNKDFVTAYGNNFSLIVCNYSAFAVITNITSSSTAKIGEESVLAVEPEITPVTARIETGESGLFMVSCEPVVPQETTLTMQFEKVPTARFKLRTSTNTGYIGYLVTNDPGFSFYTSSQAAGFRLDFKSTSDGGNGTGTVLDKVTPGENPIYEKQSGTGYYYKEQYYNTLSANFTSTLEVNPGDFIFIFTHRHYSGSQLGEVYGAGITSYTTSPNLAASEILYLHPGNTSGADSQVKSIKYVMPSYDIVFNVRINSYHFIADPT